MKDVYHLHDKPRRSRTCDQGNKPKVKEKEKGLQIDRWNRKMKLMGYLIMFE